MSGYRVDHWYLWSNGQVRCKTYRYKDYEDALERFNGCSEILGTTRVALRSSGPGKSSAALKVWTSP